MIRSAGILAAIVATLLATPVTALDRIAIYADPAFTDCDIAAAPSSMVTLYIGHEAIPGALGSLFRVATPACWAGAMLLATTPAPGFSAIGNAETGVAFIYPGCMAGAFLIGTLTYFSSDQDVSCCWLRIGKAPDASLDGVMVTDCAATPRLGTAPFQFIVNPNSFCYCYSTVHTSTWGSIKALYR